jgi:hypothetical protein
MVSEICSAYDKKDRQAMPNGLFLEDSAAIGGLHGATYLL